MAVISSIGYKVVVGKTALTALNAFLKKNKYTSYFILCDENTLQHCLPMLITACPALAAAELLEIESGEDSKSMEVAVNLLQTLIETGAGKTTLFVNLGGGVVSDLGGFVASIYKRGIACINIPTSLLAMADASVGGKTGIDFAAVKNSVGTITQPHAVFIDPAFLKTLPPKQFKNGLAEVYKIALVSDAELWQQLKQPSAKADALITRSIQLKNNIVIKDPLDKGIRKSLNFGHTVGHALEALLLNTPQELLHGEAVVIGMIAESHLAYQKKLVSKNTLNEITQLLQKEFNCQPLTGISMELLMERMLQDKKNNGSQIRFSLIRGIGRAELDVPLGEAAIKKAMEYYNTLA